MPEEKNANLSPKYLWIILAAVILAIAVVLIFAKTRKNQPENISQKPKPLAPKEKMAEVKKFASEQEFKDYLEKARSVSGFLGGRGGGPAVATLDAKSTGQFANPLEASTPARFSETNIQTAGIDEPDAVKTDGNEIYFSVPRPQIMPLDDTVGRPDESKELMPLIQTGGTKTIKAFPPENLKVDAKVASSGDLLLAGKTLVIMPTERYYWSKNANKIYGYDITNPESPKEIWNIELKNNTSIAGARLYKDKIYLVLKTDFSEDHPCLLKPLAIKGADYSVKCTDIYHPLTVVPSESTYTAMIINPANGEAEKSVSFIGSSDYASSVVYMSPEALYMTYYSPGDFVKILNSFFSDNKDLVPAGLVEKLKNLENYDISSSAKMTEVWELLGRYQNSLSDDDRLKLQNEMANRMSDFMKKRNREMDSTGIVKINKDTLSIDATGSVPGKLLNQFSLDEYRGDLRVATTIGENFFGWGFGFSAANRSSESVSDVYILGDDLKTEGSVIDLGKGERIYAARFLDDKGYIVTFKQTDPFFVLDLSDPMNPEQKGELKIPGYSSYLHPIAKNRILGVGVEEGKVKISLFDVGSASDPKEVAKYNLDEYWSEALNNHHAFLQDAKHEIFFLPGGKGGYVFSYTGDKLELKKAISDLAVKRAIYINDYLYVIGENKLTVFDERNWDEMKSLEL